MANEIYTTGVQSIPPGESLSLNPGTGREATVHNISVSGPASLEVYDLVQDTSITVDAITDPAGGTWMGMFIHCTENCYYTILNLGVAYINVNANGRYSK